MTRCCAGGGGVNMTRCCAGGGGGGDTGGGRGAAEADVDRLGRGAADGDGDGAGQPAGHPRALRLSRSRRRPTGRWAPRCGVAQAIFRGPRITGFFFEEKWSCLLKINTAPEGLCCEKGNSEKADAGRRHWRPRIIILLQYLSNKGSAASRTN